MGCWRPGEKEWKPLRRRGAGQTGRKERGQEVTGRGQRAGFKHRSGVSQKVVLRIRQSIQIQGFKDSSEKDNDTYLLDNQRKILAKL